MEGDGVNGVEESFAGVCRLGRVIIGGSTGLVEVSNARVVWRAGEFPVEGRLFCKRLGDGFSCSEMPKLKVPDPPKLIRREDARWADTVSLDEVVERDQRLRLATPSVLGRRCNSGEITV